MDENQGAPLLAGAYFDFLFGEEQGWACIRTYKNGRFGHPDGPVDRHWFKWPIQRNEMVGLVLANPELDLYVIPALYKNRSSNRASNIMHQTCVYVDADDADPSLFKVTPTIVLQTSRGHTHLLWKTTTDNSPALCRVGKAISHAHADQGCDKGGWDAGQLLRIPGSTNNKPNRNAWHIKAYTTGELFDIETLKEAYPDAGPTLAEQMAAMPHPSEWPTLEDAEEFINRHLDLLDLYELTPDFKDKDGKRYRENIPFDASGRMWRLLSEFSRRGLHPTTAFVLAWNAGCCKYRLDGRPEHELWREICKAYAEPENAPAGTEAEIEVHQERIVAELAERDGREVVREYRFLREIERPRVEDDTIVDRYVRWAREITDAAPQYQRAGIMTVLSAVLGEFGLPPTKFYMGRLNLWFLVLGGTTRSRKSTARHMWLKLLRDLQDNTYNYDIGSDVTPEALAEELAGKPGWSSVFHRDEVSGLLGEQTSKGYLSGLQENMTELYDGHVRMRKRIGAGGGGGKKGVGTSRATTTNFVMNFSGVTKHVTEVLSDKDFASGYLARFLYVHAEPPVRTRIGERMEQFEEVETSSSIQEDIEYMEMREEIKQMRTFWERRAKRGNPVRIPFESDAWDRLNDLAWDLGSAAAESDMAEMLEPVVDRMAKSILKVSCLLAMADMNVTVKMRHVLKAIQLGEEWFHYMLVVANMVRASDWQRQQDAVIAVIDSTNGRITWNNLYKKFRGTLKPKEFEEIIKSLTESEEVSLRTERQHRVLYRTGAIGATSQKPGKVPAVSAGENTAISQGEERSFNGNIAIGIDADSIPA
jgi:hypothetical protein